MIKPENLTFNQFHIANAQRTVEVFHPIFDWSPTDWGCALAGEAGELCNLLKKHRRGENITILQVENEIGDVMAYLDLLATRMTIDVATATIRKFNTISKRKGSHIVL